MKKLIHLFLLPLLLCGTTYAIPYNIHGRITGNHKLQYAYALDNKYKIIKMERITEGKFNFSGDADVNQPFGQIPIIIIILNKDSLSQNEIDIQRLASKRKHYNCKIIVEGEVSLVFDAEKRIFTIAGGPLNRTQNLFERRLALYRNSRDSAFSIIDGKAISDQQKFDEKTAVQLKIFTGAMYELIRVVKQYPDEASLDNFSLIAFDQGVSVKDLVNAFSLFPTALKNTQKGKTAYGFIQDKIKAEEALAKPPYSIGMKFPDFELADLAGKPHKGTELLGKKYTLIDFWATWCAPCRKETPNLIKACQTFHDKGFNVVTISIDEKDDREKWVKAVRDDKMDAFHNLFNGSDQSGLARELKVVSIPMNYLVDDKGTIVATNLRGEQLTIKLKALLGDHGQ